MDDFKMSEVNRVRDVYGQVPANKLIGLGWVLLGTSHGKDESGYPITLYSLGWTQNLPPQDPL